MMSLLLLLIACSANWVAGSLAKPGFPPQLSIVKLSGSTGRVLIWFRLQSSQVKLSGSSGRNVRWLLPQSSRLKLAGSSGRFVSWLLKQ